MAFGNITNQIKSALRDEVTGRVSESLGDLGINTGKRASRNNSISEFQASLERSSGMARTNKYEVQIIAPPKHPGGQDVRTINLHCNSITMPGHNLEQQVQRFGSEPATELVTSHTFAGNITATFYLDASLETKAWFDKWQELAVNPITHKAAYYKDYAEAEMNIWQRNGQDGVAGRTYGVKCEEVYPATVSPIEYSYEGGSEIATLSVEFAYRKWRQISDTESGTTVRREQYINTSSERLSGNGVLDANAIANGLGYSSVSSLKKYLKGQV